MSHVPTSAMRADIGGFIHKQNILLPLSFLFHLVNDAVADKACLQAKYLV